MLFLRLLEICALATGKTLSTTGGVCPAKSGVQNGVLWCLGCVRLLLVKGVRQRSEQDGEAAPLGVMFRHSPGTEISMCTGREV